MCGLTGVLWRAGSGAGRDAEARVAEMAARIAHRGPDASGTWADPDAGIALGHRRLSILDLSDAGAQPMPSPSGRYRLVFNGEIYNHPDLRRRLEDEGRAPPWRGTSDTETLAAAIDAWGLDETLGRASGMLALALWDRRERVLSLARDRFGEKPLYYGWQGSGAEAAFLFGSELRALRAHPAFAGDIAPDDMPHYTRYGYLPVGRSIYRGIGQVRPGEIVSLAAAAPEPRTRSYWNAAETARRTRLDAPFTGTEAEALDRLEQLAATAVERQMLSDVALGAFLSGGIDSSTVVALMQRASGRPVHTFAIGFEEPRYDESAHASAVAAHLGTDHTELRVDDATLRDVIPTLPEIYDEPFADVSQIPTFLVARLARTRVTVALSGDGGDELFGGYERYRKGARLFAALARVPLPLRRAGAAAVRALPAGLLAPLLAPTRHPGPGQEPNVQWARRLASYTASPDLDTLHRRLAAQTTRTAELTGSPLPRPMSDVPEGTGLAPAERMMQLDLASYLPGFILTKVDRATMAVSLESRAPLLDPALAGFALSLPERFRIRDGTSKWLLRQLCYRLVPRPLVDRPKMGFEVPTGPWLRGPLAEWAGDLLSPDAVARTGRFAPPAVTRMWEEHRGGRYDHGRGLWHVVMYQAWHARWHG